MGDVSFKNISNNKGMATLEALPILVVFMMLISYGLGLYGTIHSATLSSIAARSYAFETFRHRADLVYFRSNHGGAFQHYRDIGVRYHGAVDPGTDDTFRASEKDIYVGRRPAAERRNLGADDIQLHNERIYGLNNGERNTRDRGLEVSPIWIKVGYGMCITASCGDN